MEQQCTRYMNDTKILFLYRESGQNLHDTRIISYYQEYGLFFFQLSIMSNKCYILKVCSKASAAIYFKI